MSSSFEGIYEPGIVDPNLPVAHPTTPFWHSSRHRLANFQSPWPDHADIVIIGSGISGMSLARTLLSKNPGLSVVLVEARELCSGATGRNGGHIKTMTFAMWEDRKKMLDLDEAVRITLFEDSHLDTMAAAIREDGIDCDLVLTEGVDAYYDQSTFDRAVKALEEMRAHVPSVAAKHKVYTDRTHLQEVMKLSPRCVGAISVPAASVWPYKWITGVIGNLVDSGKLNLQTHTPVHRIIDHPESDSATVQTIRGDIKAKHIIHATNAWTGHLLHELRPFISPVRGNVVHHAQAPLGISPKYSFWLRHGAKDYDYLIQRKDGGSVLGRANTARRATADDSKTDLAPMAHLRGVPDLALASPAPGSSAKITHAWSGILAFTQDGLPFAGRLPFPGRAHQWACAAYHATGMVRAFRTAQAVAALVLGEDPGSGFPRSMLVTADRVEGLKRSVELGRVPVFKAKL